MNLKRRTILSPLSFVMVTYTFLPDWVAIWMTGYTILGKKDSILIFNQKSWYRNIYFKSYISHIYVPFNSGEICFADKQALWSDPDEQLLSLRVTRRMPLHAIVVEGGNQLQGLIFCWSLTNTLQCLMPQTNTIKTWKTALLLHKTIWITSFFFYCFQRKN